MEEYKHKNFYTHYSQDELMDLFPIETLKLMYTAYVEQVANKGKSTLGF